MKTGTCGCKREEGQPYYTGKCFLCEGCVKDLDMKFLAPNTMTKIITDGAFLQKFGDFLWGSSLFIPTDFPPCYRSLQYGQICYQFGKAVHHALPTQFFTDDAWDKETIDPTTTRITCVPAAVNATTVGDGKTHSGMSGRTLLGRGKGSRTKRGKTSTPSPRPTKLVRGFAQVPGEGNCTGSGWKREVKHVKAPLRPGDTRTFTLWAVRAPDWFYKELFWGSPKLPQEQLDCNKLVSQTSGCNNMFGGAKNRRPRSVNDIALRCKEMQRNNACPMVPDGVPGTEVVDKATGQAKFPFFKQFAYPLSTRGTSGFLTPSRMPSDYCVAQFRISLETCNTCCCKKGLILSSVKSALVMQDKTGNCEPWFTTYVDFGVRSAALVFRSLEATTLFSETCSGNGKYTGVKASSTPSGSSLTRRRTEANSVIYDDSKVWGVPKQGFNSLKNGKCHGSFPVEPGQSTVRPA